MDYKKELKEFYAASAKQPVLVEVPTLNYLRVDGIGDPNTSSAYRKPWKRCSVFPRHQVRHQEELSGKVEFAAFTEGKPRRFCISAPLRKRGRRSKSSVPLSTSRD